MREMERLKIVLDCEPANQELAVKLGQLALAIGEHQTALNTLKAFETEDMPVEHVIGGQEVIPGGVRAAPLNDVCPHGMTVMGSQQGH